MKLSCAKKKRLDSATIPPMFWLILGCFSIFALTTYALAQPAWWNSRGAVLTPQVTTNNGVVTINYVPNDYAVVTQGQLKQFTARAVDELNANLPGGAGTNLNAMVSNWQVDYTINGYNANNIKPSDYTAMNVGQLKYIGNQIWTQLVASGYTNAVPSWLAVNTNTDNVVANLGQLKEVFNFDLSTWQPPGTSTFQITSAATVTSALNIPFTYAITASSTPTHFSTSGLPSGLSVNSTTGIISGTPTGTGIFSVNLTATNGSGSCAGVLVINVVSSTSAPVINSPTVALATVGVPFAYQITANNNPTQFTASNLPPGLSLNPTTGAISGTPTTATTYTLNLSASNGAGTGSAALSLAVNNGSGDQSSGILPTITSSLTASGTSGQSFSYTITASNNPTSYGAIGLPTGLSVNSATGVISGTLTAGGTYSTLISATNAYGTTSSFLSLNLNSTTPTVTSSTTASATAGTVFSYLITASNNPSSFSASLK